MKHQFSRLYGHFFGAERRKSFGNFIGIDKLSAIKHFGQNTHGCGGFPSAITTRDYVKSWGIQACLEFIDDNIDDDAKLRNFFDKIRPDCPVGPDFIIIVLIEGQISGSMSSLMGAWASP